ncbi:MAG: fibronectin type III domain-containing protein [Deltaproteobacteria bacterium]|nr:fibronectin type III domain-containing protein [Deltaproteobacteria bacterium]
MVLTHLLKNEAGKRTSLFLVLALTFLSVFFIIPAISIQNIHAAEITLAWDQNSEPDIAGYRVYYGQESHSYTNVVDVGNYTSCVIADLEDGGTYFFAATAYNTDGFESGYSNEISNGEPGATPDQAPDDGDGGAAGGGSGGGGSSCFIDTTACGFPVAQLKESTLCGFLNVKRIIQHIIFHN